MIVCLALQLQSRFAELRGNLVTVLRYSSVSPNYSGLLHQ